MTALVDNRIDELIGRMKMRTVMQDFTFIPAYPPHKTPNPVRRYTVAVEHHEMTDRMIFIGNRVGRGCSGFLADVELRLRVYAPERSSGSGLLRASSLVADAVEGSDSEGWLTGLTLYGIGFDTASHSEYRDVVVKLRIPLDEEAW